MKVLQGLALISGVLVLVAVGCSDDGDDGGSDGSTGGSGGSSSGTGGSSSGSGGSSSGSGGSAGYDPRCVDFWEWANANCAPPDPVDPVASCQAMDQLYHNGNCLTEYEALLSCIAANQASWVCQGGTYCQNEAGAAYTCLEPYCTGHPDEC
jgi:hypothetical protein